jgi:hypothetical protein
MTKERELGIVLTDKNIFVTAENTVATNHFPPAPKASSLVRKYGD